METWDMVDQESLVAINQLVKEFSERQLNRHVEALILNGVRQINGELANFLDVLQQIKRSPLL